MKRLTYLLIGLWLGMTNNVFAESYSSLTQSVDNTLNAKCLDDAQTSVSIVALPTGQTIYNSNADAPLLPASTLKVVTTAAALDYLGPEFRFQTEISHTGERVGDIVQGDLVIKGGGDPKLTGEQLWRIAKQIKDSGIHTFTGNLIADTSFFDSLDRAPAWEETRSQRAYDAKIGALSLNFNTTTVHIQPAESAGQRLIAWLEPASNYIQLQNETKTVKRGRNTISARRYTGEQNEMVVKVRGQLPINASEKLVRLNIDEPARYTAEVFRTYLNQLGVDISGRTRISSTPVRARLLYTHASEPLSLILKELNTYSSNFMAEQILKTMAATESGKPGTHYDGLTLVSQFLKRQAIDTSGLVLADGSGLSRRNRFTAHAMTDLLSSMYPRFDIGPDFLASLRVMGAEGVHSNRLANSPARGKIRAKTGTLYKVSTLTGYVPSQDGRRVFAYALFLNNNRCGKYGADKIEDKIVNAIYSYGSPDMMQSAVSYK